MRIIISAEISTKTQEENKKRTDALLSWFRYSSTQYNEVTGMYKGSIERSFIINIEENELGLYLDLASSFHQEAILILDNDNIATLYYLETDKTEVIGQFQPLDSYTRVGDTVYTCEPIKTVYNAVECKPQIRRL